MVAHPERAESPEPPACEIRLGTQGWSYPGWIGPFYPRGPRHPDLLHIYARAFDTVELDTTFHAVPRHAVVAGWRVATPPGFIFSAKLPRTITHLKRLRGTEPDLEAFLDALGELGDRLGPLLIQLPPDMHGDERPTLEAFLARLPTGYRWAVEVRHRSWIHPDLFDMLASYNVAWTVLDLHGMPTVPETTTDFAYVRWLGDRRAGHRSDAIGDDREEHLDRWETILRDLSFRVDRIYGYVSDTWGGHAPGMVRAFQRRLGLDQSTAPADAPLQPSLFPESEP